MKRITAFFFVAILALPAFAKDLPYSATRPENKDWQVVAKERRLRASYYGTSAVVDVAQSALKADISKVTKWDDYADIESHFLKLRDYRFVAEESDHTKTGPLRRSTWLYPDDGCFARAHLIEENLKAWGHKTTTKIFAFGNLRVQTKNAPSGSVGWWYHVAPVVSDGINEYVLDPSIDSSKPLLMNDWLQAMGHLDQLKISICDAGAYTPYSDCESPNLWDAASALDDQASYLDDERDRIEELGRDAGRELGDYPPWLELVMSPPAPSVLPL